MTIPSTTRTPRGRLLDCVQQYVTGTRRYASPMTAARSGRPRATSREQIAEAACELYLERGFGATSIGDIARRAGVGRSSFFNYFASKSDVLWSSLDAEIDEAVRMLRTDTADPVAAGTAAPESAPRRVRAAADRLLARLTPDALALALANADAMGIADELARESAERGARLGAAFASALRGAGAPRVHAEIAGAAHAAAVLAAISAWAGRGAARADLAAIGRDALDVAASTLPAA